VLHRITAIVGTTAPREGEIFIGDDAAVLQGFAGQAIISTDVCVYGVHLDRDLFSLEDLGFKAVTSALSDLAAMGALPRGIVIGVSAPAGTDMEALHRGVSLASTLCDAPVVGGDLTSGVDISIAVTVFGECPGGGAVLRSGARPGDGIYVTAPLGRAAAGLRLARSGVSLDDELVLAQRRPWPRLREGLALRGAGVSAMMDLSDGLSTDLHRLADASQVGFALTSVPVATGATLEEALNGGEDYELLLTTSDEARLLLVCADRNVPAPIRVGTITSDVTSRTLDGDVLRRGGWEHRL
jgi:thiamine-monophosphate kinase